MDIKQIRKKLQTSIDSDKQNTIDQQAIAEKGIKDALKYREKRIEEIKNDKNRILNFQKKVKDYNERKFKQYNDVLEALKESSKDYYQYFKKYEKEHGWQKTTRVLEKHNFMEQWIDFNNLTPIPIKVATRAPSPEKISPPEPLPTPETILSESKLPPLPKTEIITDKKSGKKYVVESYYDEVFTPEEQYINEEKMENNLLKNPDMEYIKFRMLRAGFSEYDVIRVAEKLTPQERIRLCDELERYVPFDDEPDQYITSPIVGQMDDWLNEQLNEEYRRISNILNNYEIWW